jgi:hypothetical protein
LALRVFKFNINFFQAMTVTLRSTERKFLLWEIFSTNGDDFPDFGKFRLQLSVRYAFPYVFISPGGKPFAQWGNTAK